MYQKRDGQPIIKKNKKTLFDELWEKNNPEEAK